MQTPIQWEPGTLSPGVKWLGCETDHSLPSSAEANNECLYTSNPSICLHCMHKDNFTNRIRDSGEKRIEFWWEA